MPKISPEQLAKRREEILDQSLECFAVRGFHQTSMRDLCAELGLSLGGLYIYFRSKEEIIGAFVDRYRRQIMGLFELATPEMSFKEAMRIIGEVKMSALGERQDLQACSIWMQIVAEAAINPEIRSLIAEFYDFAEDKLAELITAAQRSGELSPDLKARHLARILVYFGDGFDISRIVAPREDGAQTVRLLLQLVHAGAASRRSRRPPKGKK